jgi:hypothetical protein
MSDEELDALFQRGAAAYPDEMPAAAWARMETKLDDAARTQDLRRKVGRFFVGELLLIAGLLWQIARIAAPTTAPAVTYRQRVAGQAATRATASPTKIALHGPFAQSVLRGVDTASVLGSSTAPTPSFGTAPGSHAYTAPMFSSAPGRSLTTSPLRSQPAALTPLAATTKASKPTRALASTASIAALAPARTTRSRRIKAEQATLPTYTDNRNEALAAGLIEKRMGRKWPNNQPLVLADTNRHLTRSRASYKKEDNLLQATKLAQATTVDAGEPIDLLEGRVVSLPVARYPLPDLSRQLVVQRPAADTTQSPRHRAPRPPYRVLVGLLAGPSFSGVRTAQTAQLGADYGLTVEYRFGPRWRMRAGLLSSQKRYQAASTDYVAPAAWQWFGGTYDLQANCRITEIPLDLRYDVLSKPAYTVFTSLGINSLLMRDERYSYDWTANGQTFTKSAEVLKGSNHFLSVLNVSAGFEKPLGQRWSAQVEPFWQFPLGGVGAGKVRLTSAGASFSLKFGLVK